MVTETGVENSVAGREGVVHRLAVLWRKLRRPLFQAGLVLGDFVAPLLAFAGAFWLRYSDVPRAPLLMDALANSGVQVTLLLAAVLHVFLLQRFGIYKPHRIWLPLDLLLRLTVVCIITVLLSMALGRGVHAAFSSRILLGYFWLLLMALTLAEKLLGRIVVLAMLCLSIGEKKVVVIGNTETARQLVASFRSHPRLGYRVIAVAYRGESESALQGLKPGPPVTGAAGRIIQRLMALSPDLVVVAMSARKDDDVLNLIAHCSAMGVQVRLVPEFFEVYAPDLTVDRIGTVPLVHLRMPRIPLLSALTKRGFDTLLALALLPVFMVTWLLFKLRAPGRPVLGRVRRAGRNNRLFRMFVFRPQDGEPEHDESHSALVTWTGLLPQVLNVLAGQMSMVGPEARTPELVTHFNSWERRLLAVRPGVLGYRAVDGAPDEGAEELRWDISYVDRRSLAFDVNHAIVAFFRITFGQHKGSEQV